MQVIGGRARERESGEFPAWIFKSALASVEQLLLILRMRRVLFVEHPIICLSNIFSIPASLVPYL